MFAQTFITAEQLVATIATHLVAGAMRWRVPPPVAALLAGGADRSLYVQALSNLGTQYWRLGNFPDAERTLKLLAWLVAAREAKPQA